jgi:hypothetical protein
MLRIQNNKQEMQLHISSTHRGRMHTRGGEKGRESTFCRRALARLSKFGARGKNVSLSPSVAGAIFVVRPRFESNRIFSQFP